MYMENKISKPEFVGIIAYIFLIIGVFLPWAEIRLNCSFYIYGIDGDGNFLLIFGVLGLIGLVYGYIFNIKRLSSYTMIIFSSLSLIILTNTSNNVSFGVTSYGLCTSMGVGFILDVLSTIAIFISGVVLLSSLSKNDSERKK